MGSQRSFFFAGTIFLLHAVLLASQLSLASSSRHLQWLELSRGEGLSIEEEYSMELNDDHQRWRRGSMDLSLNDDGSGDEGDESGNCSKIEGSPHLELYNDTCDYVKHECEDKYELFNYLRFSFCSLKYTVRTDMDARNN